MGRMLRSWLLSQLARSVIVALILWLALQVLGVPGAPLLGLQAGVANFVPYLGPLIAALPIALAAMPLGLSTVAWVLAIYFVIQTIEGFVIAPLIQKEAVNVPPAWTLFAIVILGAMFGIMGVALAAPLVAVGRLALLRFYVEDWLGDRSESMHPQRLTRGGRQGESLSRERGLQCNGSCIVCVALRLATLRDAGGGT